MEGINFVRLKGILKWPKPGKTQGGYPRFTGRVAVPLVYEKNGEKVETEISHNVSAWGPTAEGLGELADGTPVEVVGHINTRSYDGRCKHCDGTDKKYWTEVQVETFVVCVDDL